MGNLSQQGTGGRPAVVSADDAFAVIDLVNRLNAAFDAWDVDTMVGLFAEDCVLHHPRGEVHGHDELRTFYDAYFPLTPGVRRHNVNHVVDAGEDGTLTVTSQSMLVRIARAEEAARVDRDGLTLDATGLPAIFSHARTVDRFRRHGDRGWRFLSRRVEDTVANAALRPGTEGSPA